MRSSHNKTMALRVFITSSAILLSRITGFARDMVFANLWGTGIVMSAFAWAFKIPNTFRALFGEGALTSAFIPIFSRKQQEHGKASAIEFAGNIISVTALLLALISAILIIISFILRPFFPSELVQFTLQLIPWLLPFNVLVCTTALLSAVLNSLNVFLIPTMMSSLLNIVMILSAGGIAPQITSNEQSQVKILAIGILIGGVLQVLILVKTLSKRGIKIKPDFKVGKEFNYLMKLATPALIGAGLYQFNSLIDSFLAAIIGEQAVASLYFSQRIIYLPIGIFAVALSTVALPEMSRAASDNNIPKLKESLTFSLRTVFFLTIPCAAFLFTFSKESIQVIFERGSFDAESTKQTLNALIFYVLGIPFFAASKVIVPAFHSRLDIKTPIKTGTICLFINLVLNIILMQYLRQGGLALATSISSACNCLFLTILLRKDIGRLHLKPMFAGVGSIIMATTIAVVTAVVFFRTAVDYEVGTFFSTLTAFVTGGFSYLLVTKLMRLPEADLFLSFINKKE